MRHLKTPSEVKRQFNRMGKSIAGWAKRHDVHPATVYAVLAGTNKGLRGEAHKVAVLLGIKDGVV